MSYNSNKSYQYPLFEPIINAMISSIPHAIASAIHYVVCIDIPYGHMTMSHYHLICRFDHLVCLVAKKHIRWLEFICNLASIYCENNMRIIE